MPYRAGLAMVLRWVLGLDGCGVPGGCAVSSPNPMVQAPPGNPSCNSTHLGVLNLPMQLDANFHWDADIFINCES